MTSQNSHRTTWDTGETVITPARTTPAPASTTAVKPGWVIGLSALASFVLGIVLVVAGTLASQSSSSSTPGTLRGFGVFFIVMSVLAGIVGIGVVISKEIAKEQAWKRTLPPDQRLAVEAAETAALYATWAVVHHNVQQSKARHLAEWNARSAAYTAGQAQRQQDQIAADLHTIASQQGPAPRVTATYGSGPLGGQRLTPRSDLYGNLI